MAPSAAPGGAPAGRAHAAALSGVDRDAGAPGRRIRGAARPPCRGMAGRDLLDRLGHGDVVRGARRAAAEPGYAGAAALWARTGPAAGAGRDRSDRAGGPGAPGAAGLLGHFAAGGAA